MCRKYLEPAVRRSKRLATMASVCYKEDEDLKPNKVKKTEKTKKTKKTKKPKNTHIHFD
jgi:hypothetical protein